MHKFLHHAGWRLWQWLLKLRNERREAAARARFWADVNEGRREAQERSTQ
jgi:hypothetical protein